MKRPERYADILAASQLPIAEEEQLTEEIRRFEAVMLGLRLKEGIDAGLVDVGVDKHEKLGLLTVGERIAVTDKGRLLVDGIVTDLLAHE